MYSPPLVRLPFLDTEKPHEVWQSCVKALEKWQKELSKEYKSQMERFSSDVIAEVIYETNHLEGTLPDGLSKDEALAILYTKHKVDASKPGVSQIIQHLEAFNLILSSLEDNLTEHLIKKAHRIMMNGLSNEQGLKINAGEYRKISVVTGSGHIYPSHTCILPNMNRIVKDYNMKISKPDHDPYELASWLYFEVVSLHPFEDGNGRTSRLLWCYSLMKDGLPFPAVLSSGHKKSQKHLVRCIERDRVCFYTNHPHITALTVHSVNQSWEEFYQWSQIKVKN